MKYVVASALLFFSSFVFASPFTKVKDLSLPSAQYASFIDSDILLVGEGEVQILRHSTLWQANNATDLKNRYVIDPTDKMPVQFAVRPFNNDSNYSGTKIYYDYSKDGSAVALANAFEGAKGKVSETAGMVFSSANLAQKVVLKHQLKYEKGQVCWLFDCPIKQVSRFPAAVSFLSNGKTVAIVYYHRLKKYLENGNFGGIIQPGYRTYATLSDICYWEVKNGKPKGCTKVNGSPVWNNPFKFGNSAVTSDKNKIIFDRTNETTPGDPTFGFVNVKFEMDIKTGKVLIIKTSLGYALGSSMKLDNNDHLISCSSSWDLQLSGTRLDGTQFLNKLGFTGDRTANSTRCSSVAKMSGDNFGVTFVTSETSSHLKVFDSKGNELLSEVSPQAPLDGEQFLDHNREDNLLMFFKASSRSNSSAEIWSY